MPQNGVVVDLDQRKNTSTSAEHALRAVLLLAERGELSVSELARELGVAPSTAHRILANCRRVGFARQDSQGGAYLAGPAIHEIALLASGSLRLRDAAGQVLSELHAEVDQTCVFYILEGRQVRVVQALPGSRSSNHAPILGMCHPAHCTAAGKAMLSTQSSEQLDKRFPGHRLAGHADHVSLDWVSFRAELDLVRRRGWAVSAGETDPAVTGLAVPVVLSNGTAAGAVGMVGYASWLRTRAEIESLTPALIAAANEIGLRLRGTGDR